MEARKSVRFHLSFIYSYPLKNLHWREGLYYFNLKHVFKNVSTYFKLLSAKIIQAKHNSLVSCSLLLDASKGLQFKMAAR